VTGDAVAHRTFGPLLRAMPRVPAPLTYRPPDGHTAESHARACAEALEAEFQRQGPRTVLAVIMEPIGGLASGATVAPDAYYDAVRATCDRHGALLIFDEVMSGAGRTGRFLAADHWPRGHPDLVTLAKGLAAGYTPFGAVLAPDRVVDAVAGAGGFNHGHTYFSNPLSCAVAHAVVRETVDRDLIGNAARMGTRLREALYTRRTSGGAYGDWVMVTPPLIIDAAGVDELAERLAASVGVLEAELERQGALG
jgi:adenosylmethionine-8-amino-7-oxononanoate aminotransferase